MPWNLTAPVWKKLFPNLTRILKLYMTLPIHSCEVEKKRSTMLQESLNCLCSLYRKWYFKTVVIWWGDQRVCSQKMYEIKVLQRCDKQLLNKKEYVIFIYFVMFEASSNFFKFIICWAVSSHSQRIFTLVPNLVFALLYSCSLTRAPKIVQALGPKKRGSAPATSRMLRKQKLWMQQIP
jgi:hypothetical protein